MNRSKNVNSSSRKKQSNNSRQTNSRQSNARESMNKMKYEIANEFGVDLGPGSSRTSKNSRGESEKSRSKSSKKEK